MTLTAMTWKLTKQIQITNEATGVTWNNSSNSSNVLREGGLEVRVRTVQMYYRRV